MNPNEILSQWQAQQQSTVQFIQHFQIAIICVTVIAAMVHGWVIYMFYARLRDIADELRKMRVTYEMSQERAIRGVARPPTAGSAENPFASDTRYMPKK